MTREQQNRIEIMSMFAETQKLAYNEGTRLHPSRGTCEDQFMPEKTPDLRKLRRSIKVPTNYKKNT